MYDGDLCFVLSNSDNFISAPPLSYSCFISSLSRMPPPEPAAISGDPDGSSTRPTTEEESRVHQLKIAQYFVNRTKTICAIFLALPIVAIAIIFVTGVFDIDSPSGADYFVRNDLRTRLYDARRAAKDEFPYNLAKDRAITKSDDVQNEELGWFKIVILLRGRNATTGATRA